ncbi:hypothetical protein ACFSB0_11040 [Aeromicrobium camelliae]
MNDAQTWTVIGSLVTLMLAFTALRSACSATRSTLGSTRSPRS